MMTLVRIELYPCEYFLTANCLHASCSRDLLAVGCFGAAASLLAASPSRTLAASAFSGAFSVPVSPFYGTSACRSRRVTGMLRTCVSRVCAGPLQVVFILVLA